MAKKERNVDSFIYVSDDDSDAEVFMCDNVASNHNSHVSAFVTTPGKGKLQANQYSSAARVLNSRVEQHLTRSTEHRGGPGLVVSKASQNKKKGTVLLILDSDSDYDDVECLDKAPEPSQEGQSQEQFEKSFTNVCQPVPTQSSDNDDLEVTDPLPQRGNKYKQCSVNVGSQEEISESVCYKGEAATHTLKNQHKGRIMMKEDEHIYADRVHEDAGKQITNPENRVPSLGEGFEGRTNKCLGVKIIEGDESPEHKTKKMRSDTFDCKRNSVNESDSCINIVFNPDTCTWTPEKKDRCAPGPVLHNTGKVKKTPASVLRNQLKRGTHTVTRSPVHEDREQRIEGSEAVDGSATLELMEDDSTNSELRGGCCQRNVVKGQAQEIHKILATNQKRKSAVVESCASKTGPSEKCRKVDSGQTSRKVQSVVTSKPRNIDIDSKCVKARLSAKLKEREKKAEQKSCRLKIPSSHAKANSEYQQLLQPVRPVLFVRSSQEGVTFSATVDKLRSSSVSLRDPLLSEQEPMETLEDKSDGGDTLTRLQKVSAHKADSHSPFTWNDNGAVDTDTSEDGMLQTSSAGNTDNKGYVQHSLSELQPKENNEKSCDAQLTASVTHSSSAVLAFSSVEDGYSQNDVSQSSLLRAQNDNNGGGPGALQALVSPPVLQSSECSYSSQSGMVDGKGRSASLQLETIDSKPNVTSVSSSKFHDISLSRDPVFTTYETFELDGSQKDVTISKSFRFDQDISNLDYKATKEKSTKDKSNPLVSSETDVQIPLVIAEPNESQGNIECSDFVLFPLEVGQLQNEQFRKHLQKKQMSKSLLLFLLKAQDAKVTVCGGCAETDLVQPIIQWGSLKMLVHNVNGVLMVVIRELVRHSFFTRHISDHLLMDQKSFPAVWKRVETHENNYVDTVSFVFVLYIMEDLIAQGNLTKGVHDRLLRAHSEDIKITGQDCKPIHDTRKRQQHYTCSYVTYNLMKIHHCNQLSSRNRASDQWSCSQKAKLRPVPDTQAKNYPREKERTSILEMELKLSLSVLWEKGHIPQDHHNNNFINSLQLMYPYCQCDEMSDSDALERAWWRNIEVSETENIGRIINNLGIVRFMGRNVFCFLNAGCIYISAAELEKRGLLPSTYLSLLTDEFLQQLSSASDARQMNDIEEAFLMQFFNLKDTSSEMEQKQYVFTPHGLKQLYRKLRACNYDYDSHFKAIYYMLYLGHQCAWTLQITPPTTQLHEQPGDGETNWAELPAAIIVTTSSVPGGNTRPHKECLLQGHPKEACTYFDGGAGTSPAMKNMVESLNKALQLTIEHFGLGEVAKPFCSCNIKSSQLHKFRFLRFDNIELSQVTHMMFAGKLLHCWKRDNGFFVSVAELQYRSLLVPKLLEQPGSFLVGSEKVFLSTLPEDCLCGSDRDKLISLKCLHVLITSCNTESRWRQLADCKFHIKLWKHSCPWEEDREDMRSTHQLYHERSNTPEISMESLNTTAVSSDTVCLDTNEENQPATSQRLFVNDNSVTASTSQANDLIPSKTRGQVCTVSTTNTSQAKPLLPAEVGQQIKHMSQTNDTSHSSSTVTTAVRQQTSQKTQTDGTSQSSNPVPTNTTQQINQNIPDSDSQSRPPLTTGKTLNPADHSLQPNTVASPTTTESSVSSPGKYNKVLLAQGIGRSIYTTMLSMIMNQLRVSCRMASLNIDIHRACPCPDQEPGVFPSYSFVQSAYTRDSLFTVLGHVGQAIIDGKLVMCFYEASDMFFSFLNLKAAGVINSTSLASIAILPSKLWQQITNKDQRKMVRAERELVMSMVDQEDCVSSESANLLISIKLLNLVLALESSSLKGIYLHSIGHICSLPETPIYKVQQENSLVLQAQSSWRRAFHWYKELQNQWEAKQKDQANHNGQLPSSLSSSKVTTRSSTKPDRAVSSKNTNKHLLQTKKDGLVFVRRLGNKLRASSEQEEYRDSPFLSATSVDWHRVRVKQEPHCEELEATMNTNMSNTGDCPQLVKQESCSKCKPFVITDSTGTQDRVQVKEEPGLSCSCGVEYNQAPETSHCIARIVFNQQRPMPVVSEVMTSSHGQNFIRNTLCSSFLEGIILDPVRWEVKAIPHADEVRRLLGIGSSVPHVVLSGVLTCDNSRYMCLNWDGRLYVNWAEVMQELEDEDRLLTFRQAQHLHAFLYIPPSVVHQHLSHCFRGDFEVLEAAPWVCVNTLVAIYHLGSGTSSRQMVMKKFADITPDAFSFVMFLVTGK